MLATVFSGALAEAPRWATISTALAPGAAEGTHKAMVNTR